MRGWRRIAVESEKRTIDTQMFHYVQHDILKEDKQSSLDVGAVKRRTD